jgi:hypothetical protein
MRDEHDDRLHQALRHDFASNIAEIASSIGYAFDRLHARLYDAPWARKPIEQPCGQRFTIL